MKTRDLEYDLPPDRIATHAVEPRDAARLMVVWRGQESGVRGQESGVRGQESGVRTQDTRPRTPDLGPGGPAVIEHRHVCDLADAAANLLRPGDLLVFNQSRVLPAHFEATRSKTGGHVSGLYLRSALGDERLWQVMIESGGKPAAGESIRFANGSELELIAKSDDGIWQAQLHGPMGTIDLLNAVGVVPLPPYILAQRRKHHEAEIEAADLKRYNTVFAAEPGSVAAPTAGLHFTESLLTALKQRGVGEAFVTLHVGLGTFAPIRAEKVEEHTMHREWFSVPAATIAMLEATRAAGGRIIPVGTTSVRALESLPASFTDAMRHDGCTGETDLLIMPQPRGDAGSGDRQPPSFEPYPFRFTDALMTNFHLPHSTLLALVAALPGVGIDRLKAWYRVAIDKRYRFFSYGDAMLLL